MLVIVRAPGPAFRDAISTHPDRQRIDVARAREQHAAFCAALEDAGVALLRLPEEPDLPDATFVSDTLVALSLPLLRGTAGDCCGAAGSGVSAAGGRAPFSARPSTTSQPERVSSS